MDHEITRQHEATYSIIVVGPQDFIFFLKKTCYMLHTSHVTMANKPARSFCFTINNYGDDDLLALDALETDPKVSYYVLGFEEGKLGTPHIQGYVELSKPVRLSGMQKMLGGRAHIEARKGTRDQARDYCMKDGTFEERGKWETKGQGRRTDLDPLTTLLACVKEDCDRKTLIETAPHVYSKHIRLLGEYRALCERDASRDFRNVVTTVLWGASGVGKTRRVHETEPNVFWVHPDDSFPFDGYDGEEAIAFDDFYGNMKHHEMLRILDGYPLPVNVKGGLRYARWTRVYITSNCAPKDWYCAGLRALERRLNVVTHIEAPTPPSKAEHKESNFVTATKVSETLAALDNGVVTTSCNEVGGNSMAQAPTPTSFHTALEHLLAEPANIGPPPTRSSSNTSKVYTISQQACLKHLKSSLKDS